MIGFRAPAAVAIFMLAWPPPSSRAQYDRRETRQRPQRDHHVLHARTTRSSACSSQTRRLKSALGGQE
jgi:hypothetical protein